MPRLRSGLLHCSPVLAAFRFILHVSHGGWSSADLGCGVTGADAWSAHACTSWGRGAAAAACVPRPISIGYLIRNHLADDALGCTVQDQVQVVEVPLDDVLAVRALQWYAAACPSEYPPVPCSTRHSRRVSTECSSTLEYRSVP